MLAVPVVQNMTLNMSVLTGMSVWVPPGEWIDWQTGTVVHGPATVKRSFTIREMGMYIRSGAILITKVRCYPLMRCGIV
jgi:alpha-glucosidase (family GH31 glycosyl hydrolase)